MSLLSKQILHTQETKHEKSHIKKIILTHSRKELIFKAELPYLRPQTIPVLRCYGPKRITPIADTHLRCPKLFI